MVKVVFYSLNKETNKYDNESDRGTFKNESDARIRACAFNWAYSVIAEY